MKKTFLILLTLLLAGSGFAQQAPTVKLVSSTENKVVVNVELNGFTADRVKTPTGEQFVINVPKMASMLEAGAPDLPQLPVSVMIGDRAEMTVKVTDAQYTDYTDMDIVPSKGNFSRQINPDDVPYTYGEMYQQDAFWPAAQAQLDAPYILRDFRGQNILVRPFAYNPVTRTLRVYESLTIEMTKVGDNGENQKTVRRSGSMKMDPETLHAYGRRFINFAEAGAKYPFVTDQGEMLIICADEFMEGMLPLVEWKNESGRPTTMVSVSEVGGNNTDVIKNYINNLYNDPEHNLTFVLFVGDYQHITPHPFQYNDNTSTTQYSDIWFGQLEGNDYYPEVFVGRFSVQTDAHVANYVNKAIYYERDVQSDVTWCNKGLGIGSTQEGSGGHFGEYDATHINYIRDTLLHYTYDEVYSQHQGGSGASSASASGISNYINQGVSIINYCNHGNETGWGVANYSNSHVNALTNDYKWPLVWSVACLVGKFGYSSDCFAETWMRATDNSTGAPTGAIGGMFSWLSQPWQPPMFGQDEMNAILAEWRNTDQFNHTLAGTSLNGNMYILDAAGGTAGNATHNGWILYGDPSLMVRTDTPVEMNVSFTPPTLLLGMTDMTVNAETDFGIATLYQDGEIIASGYVQNGVANLTFPGLLNIGTATLTVIGFNKVTYRSEVEIVPAEGPYLVLNDYQVATENNSLVFGEEGVLNIGVKNVGVETVNDVLLTLSSESEYITEFVNSTTVIESAAPDEVVSIENAFRFKVANNVSDGTKIPFHLSMTAGENEWEANLNLTAEAPALVCTGVNMNGTAEPGGSGTLDFVFQNEGHATAPVHSLTVFSSSSDILLENNSFEAAPLQPTENVTISVPFALAETAEAGSCYEISYLLNADFYSLPGSAFVSLGEVMEDFETGDFTTFDWTFEGPQAWVIDSTNAYAGTYCAKSGAITHSQSTKLILNVFVPIDGNISFFKKVSSENSYDKLNFLIDGQNKGEWSGTVNWSQETYPITAGNHTFVWNYTKDVSVSSGQDCAWVDDIQLPPTAVIENFAGVESLVATVDENEVVLEWVPAERAASYVVFRDGVELSTQEETGFAESVEHGTYTYSVVAVNEEGQYSKPAYVTVNVESFMGAGESMAQTGHVFPNPTEGLLNIEMEGSYRYLLFNTFGQQVMSGKAEGRTQLHLESLAKGIYVLRLSNGTLDETRKIIVK